MTLEETKSRLFALLDEQECYNRVIEKLNFDLLCSTPEDGMDQAANDMAVLGQRLYDLKHNETFLTLARDFYAKQCVLPPLEQKLAEHLHDKDEKAKNLTRELAFRTDKAISHAYGQWLKAKKAKDFSLYADDFAELIACKQAEIDLRDEKKNRYYDTCLDDMEKGGNQEQMDAFFEALKAGILPLLQKIQQKEKASPIREDFLSRPCPIPIQDRFSRYLLNLEGLRPGALVFTTTEHPFTTQFGKQDVRVATHFFEDNFISNLYSTLHEGGHALFMQNEPDEFYTGHLYDSMTNAMHECISRFYENLIGRSRAFVHYIFPKLQEFCGDLYADVSEEEFYRAVNIARPNLIRVEADELTFPLHILVRYELEKAFVNGEISVHEIPKLWNEKYKAYLGLTVPSDDLGCLQDVHWTDTGYGYFPSYALGSAYGVQILRRMEQDFDVFVAVAEGNFGMILDWMKEHVFSIASITDPDEWIRAITGEPLNPDYFLSYLEEKYTELYDL